MSQKNNWSKRKFIPQFIGDALRKVNRSFSSKFGKIEFIIHSKWPDIAGSYFSKYSEPKNITRLPDYENDLGETIFKNHLNVSVAPAAALEFQHFKGTILTKINSYFGYRAIIDLRIHQNYIAKYNDNLFKTDEIKLTETEKEALNNEVKHLSNKSLQKSLFNLGKNITKEAK